MADGFISLATILRGDDAVRAAAAPPETVAAARPESRAPVASPRVAAPLPELLEELARLRLAAIEELERRAAIAIERLASDVLARELALAPPALDALVARALAAFRDDGPIAIVVGPNATVRIECDVPVRVDPALPVGDLVVEVRHGAFESPLAFRLSEVVCAAIEADVRA